MLTCNRQVSMEIQVMHMKLLLQFFLWKKIYRKERHCQYIHCFYLRGIHEVYTDRIFKVLSCKEPTRAGMYVYTSSVMYFCAFMKRQYKSGTVLSRYCRCALCLPLLVPRTLFHLKLFNVQSVLPTCTHLQQRRLLVINEQIEHKCITHIVLLAFMK